MLGRKLACAAFMVAGFLTTSSVFGQDYVLTAGSASGMVGASVDAAVTLDITGMEVQGWSYGVCSDGAAVTLTGVASGATAQTVNGGAAASFEAINDAPIGGTGYTVGVVIDFFGVNTLLPGTGYELTVGTYTLDAEGSSALNLCGNLGDPMVETLVVVAGTSVVPVQNAGTLEAVAAPPIAIEFDASDATIAVNAMGDTTSQGTVAVLMDSEQAMDPLQAPVQGFSFGLLDGAAAELVDINIDGTATAATNGGMGPEFLAISTTPPGGDGGTVGVVVSLSPPFDDIPPGVDQNIVNFVYDAAAGAANGDTATLSFTDTLGDPPVALVAVVDGNTVLPSTDGGLLTVQEVVDVPYLRGDSNADQIVNIADGIWILNFLWQGGPPSPCAAADDANGDGAGDTSDAMYIILYRLMGGPPPVGAFPGCDSADPADCAMSVCP